MKIEADKAAQRYQKQNSVHMEGMGWIFIVGGALLGTVAIRIGCKLKQSFSIKHGQNNQGTFEEAGTSAIKGRTIARAFHADTYVYAEEEDGFYHRLSGSSEDDLATKQEPSSRMFKEDDKSLSLVTMPVVDSNGENDDMPWSLSYESLEIPLNPPHNSNSSDSPGVSESGSDAFSRREVIQKLRQQLLRREEMIMEMQAQIGDLQSSLNSFMAHSSHLQSQLDSANQGLFHSEIQILRLRKVIANHCVTEACSVRMPTNWKNDMIGHAKVHADGATGVDSHCSVVDKDGVTMSVKFLDKELEESKEVIEEEKLLL